MAFDHEGRYDRVTVKGAYLDLSSAKATPFARLTFEDPNDGDTIYKDVWLTDNNREGAAKSLKAAGFIVGQDDFAKIDGVVAGKECSIVLGNSDRGELEVKWVNPLRSAGDKSVADIANDLFGTAPAKRGKKPVAHANPPGEEDDSVPF